MTPQPSWVDGRVDALLTALHELGMSASRTAATELIHERVRWVPPRWVSHPPQHGAT
jgi:hypothetical protein